MKKSILTSVLLSLSSTFCFAQNVGYWPDNTGNATSAKTHSLNALGVGTLVPRGWQEILYCPPLNTPQNGLVVTKYGCSNSFATAWNGPDIVGSFWAFDSLVEVPDTFIVPFNFSIAHNTTTVVPTLGTENPLIWARTETPGTTFYPPLSGGANQFDTKFIVMPDGSTGINVANPRAALDVRGSNIKNHPAAIIGSRALGTHSASGVNGIKKYYTQHVEFVPVLKVKGYNMITHEDDQGIFFTDGQGDNGANASGTLVIAPWAENNDTTVGGLRIDNKGNLELHGTLKSIKVKVQPKWWSDFVFEPTYKLMPLNELEQFIKINNHLPNIPTTKEVNKEGTDVGDTQALLLQKIEELTLYVIEQDKKIDKLQKKINEK